MVKEITKNITNQEVFDFVKTILKEKLVQIALLMKNKSKLIDCGVIHNKSVKKTEHNYLWGLKFFILVLECFSMWSIIDPDNFIKEN